MSLADGLYTVALWRDLQKETTQVLLFVFIVRHCLKHVLHKIVVSPETRYQSVPCVFARRNTLTITKLSACFLLCDGYGFAKSHQYLSDETGPLFDHKGNDLASCVSSPPPADAAAWRGRGRGRVPIVGWSLVRVGSDRGLRGGRRGWCQEWVMGD